MTLNAAIYARVSTDDQVQKYGLGSQITELREIANRKGYAISGEFVDDGYSGATLDRPQLERLRAAIRTSVVDVVLIHDPDRLARKLAHQVLLMEEFERAHVRVEFATVSTEATPEGRLLLQVKGVISEYEREKIRERTGRGRREKARRGLMPSGTYPYGYRVDPERPGRLVIHEPEAAIVRMVFGWVVNEQRSGRSVVVELRRLGIRPQRSMAWGKSSVMRLLTNRIYIGEAFYNQRRVVVSEKSGRLTRHEWRPREEWIPIAVPPIVTPAIFEAAQDQIARNRAVLVGRPGEHIYLLRGLLRCACGRRLVGMRSHGDRVYRCSGHDRLERADCRQSQFRAEAADRLVWETVATIIRKPGVLLARLDQRADRLGAREVEVQSEAEHLRRRLVALERDERKLLDLYLEDALSDQAIRDRLAGVTQQRSALRERLARAERAAAEHGAQAARQDAIRGWCRTARRGLDRLDAEGRQRLLRALVEEIGVRGRELSIRGVLPAGVPADSSTVPARCARRPPRSPARAWRGTGPARR